MLKSRVEDKALIKALTHDLKKAEEKLEELSERNRMLENNNMVLLTRNKLITGLLKQIKTYTECNNLGNDEIIKRKINELAKTAIKD